MRALAAAGLTLLALLAACVAPGAVHAQAPYQIPPDNPFVGQAGARPEIYATGFRNPFRFSFDRQTGDLLIGDVGGGAREEIDWIGAQAARGANFGWPCREGKVAGPVGPPDPRCPAAAPPYVEPLFDYPTPDPGAVIGGYVVRDPALAGLAGRYLFADHYTGDIHSLRLDFADPDDRVVGPNVDRIGGFGEDAAGRLYVADLNGGEVLRLTPGATPGTVATTPAGAYAAPVAIAPEPGNADRLFVAEIAGKVKLGSDEFVDVATFPFGLTVGGERGLLSVAAAPDYETSGKVYVYYTDGDGDIRIDEVQRSATDPDVADPATRRTLLVIEHSSRANHNGGTLQFGRDGCLWVATGDGGGQADAEHNAQNLASLLGKILRIDPDPTGPACQAPAAPGGGGAGGGGTGGGGPPTAAADVVGPTIAARVKRFQRVLRLGGVVVYVRCNEPCSLIARGRLRVGRRVFRMRPAVAGSQVARRARLKLGLTRRGRRALRRAARNDRLGRVRVRVRLRATDLAGNPSPLVRRTVRVRR